jgi:geranylgeranyl diphosphate synthase type II
LVQATKESPPKLAEALRYAVFSGGGRVRPKLALAVAIANGDRNPELANAAAASLELLHCASLVHDDLPLFDDADTRRGRPSVHMVFGEEIALLVGDGLIVTAFELLARAGANHPDDLPEVLAVVAGAVGTSRGIIAGQAWESEPEIDTSRYHRAKTGSLFEAAARVGAIAGGGPVREWGRIGLLVGEAYQVADDIMDVVGDEAFSGKPIGQDLLHDRPNASVPLGLSGAIERLDTLIETAQTSLPLCRGRDEMKALIAKLARRLCPPKVRELCVGPTIAAAPLAVATP